MWRGIDFAKRPHLVERPGCGDLQIHDNRYRLSDLFKLNRVEPTETLYKTLYREAPDLERIGRRSFVQAIRLIRVEPHMPSRCGESIIPFRYGVPIADGPKTTLSECGIVSN
jgi:hypothetical protein